MITYRYSPENTLLRPKILLNSADIEIAIADVNSKYGIILFICI